MGARARTCSLTYPACNADTPCLRLLWLHHTFRHGLITGTIFGKTLLNAKFVFQFSPQLLFKHVLFSEEFGETLS